MLLNDVAVIKRGTMLKDTLKVLGVIVLCVVVLALVGALLDIPIININRYAVQGSNAYTQSKQVELVQMVTAYQDIDAEIAKYAGNDAVVNADRAKQKAILAQIKQEASLIPADAVPASVKAFISSH